MNRSTPEQLTWLAQTKLIPPRLRTDIIPRRRLLQVLTQDLLNYPVTLLSAPAGYGKTTLATSLAWAAPAMPVAWLALDEEDNNPTIFISGLVAALQTLNPACGASVQALLNSQAVPLLEIRRLMGVLINDMLETLPEPFGLVLDDLHLVTEPAVYEALNYLLDHIPWQLHLVVTTRIDPAGLSLARLRARGQLAELRLADLRFTLAEITVLLNDQFHLNLTPDDLRTLETSTEGWVAGLRLLAASLDRLPIAERNRFLTSLVGTNRHVFDFLAEEVLNRQDPAVRAFLLETAILSELSPALCRAVTGRADAATLLEEIYRRNLFLIAVDDLTQASATIYRYHALFARFLQQQLARERPAEEVLVLHRRAAAAETVPARALDHYFAAEAWDEAVQVIEQIAETTFSQGLLDRLSGWIETIPAEIRAKRPELLYFLGVCAWGQGHFNQAQALLEQALAGFAASGDERGRGNALTQLSIIYQTSGNFAPATELARQALTCPTSPRSRAQLYMAFAYLALGQGDLEQAQADLEAALALAETSGDPGALQILAMQLRSVFHCLPKGLDLMERLGRLIEQYVPDQLHPWRANLAGLEAHLHLWRGQLAAALEAGERAWSMSNALGGLPWLMVDVGPFMGQLYFLQGDSARADSAFHLLTSLVGSYPAWRALTLFPYALHLWSQDRLEEAGQVYVQMHPLASQTHEWPVGPVLRPMLRGLLEISDRNYKQAEQTLRQAQQLQQNVPVSTRFNARLLLAYLYYRWGQREVALHELASVLADSRHARLPGLIIGHGALIVEPLLELAIQHGTHVKFASTLQEILHNTSMPRSLHVPETGAVLTPREVEVLRLLVTGASNQAIAAELVVSLPTVKTHISRILGKLAVPTRTAAAARARELRLV